jgi:hypothetical protein
VQQAQKGPTSKMTENLFSVVVVDKSKDMLANGKTRICITLQFSIGLSDWSL